MMMVIRGALRKISLSWDFVLNGLIIPEYSIININIKRAFFTTLPQAGGKKVYDPYLRALVNAHVKVSSDHRQTFLHCFSKLARCIKGWQARRRRDKTQLQIIFILVM